MDSSGNMYITTSGFTYIQKFALNGTQLAIFSTSNPYMNSPKGLTVDKNGQIFVADSMNNRIVKMDYQGHQVATFVTMNSLSIPTDVAVDSDNNIFLIDNSKKFILKLSHEGFELAIITNPSWKKPSTIALDQAGNMVIVIVATT